MGEGAKGSFRIVLFQIVIKQKKRYTAAQWSFRIVLFQIVIKRNI